MKNQRNTEAVSEILGTVLLLAIAVTSVSIIYIQVLGSLSPVDTTNVTIIGKMEEGLPVFELQRGESLGPDTKIFLTLAGFERREFIQKDLGLQEWNIGERIVLPVEDITGIQADAIIVDTKTNEIVFRAVLQEGLKFRCRGGIWHFDEPMWDGTFDEVIDSSGNNNHGRRLSGAHIITGVEAKCNNSGEFDGFRDVVKVNSSWTLNITNSITIESWMKTKEPAFVADVLEVSLNFGFTPYITHINGNYYVIVSQEKQGRGVIQTVTIDPEGYIITLGIDFFGKVTGSQLLRPMIIKMTDEMFLVAFNSKSGSKQYMYMRTYNISSTGIIEYTGNELIFQDYETFISSSQPNRPTLRKITDNVCAIAYWSSNGLGILRTVNISSNGKITCIENKTDGLWYEPCLVHVTGKVYALTYRNASSNQGIIKTFNITSTGGIISTNQSIVFDTNSGYEPCLVQVSGKVFAVAYRNSINNGVVKTFNISSDGSILATGKTMVFEPIACYTPWMIRDQDDTFVIAYTTTNSGNNFGYVIEIILQKNGNIISQPNSKKEFDINRAYDPIMLNICEDLFTIVYTTGEVGPHPGNCITILIGQLARGICKGNSYMLYANMTMVEGRINNVAVTYNMLPGEDWHHFAITYNGMSICLYVNGIKVNETSYPLHRINLTNAPLYFGRFYCGYIDEIAIYDKVLTQQQILYHYNNPGKIENIS